MKQLILRTAVMASMVLCGLPQVGRADGVQDYIIKKTMRNNMPLWFQVGTEVPNDLPPVIRQADGEFEVLKKTWDESTNEFKTISICQYTKKVDVYDLTKDGDLSNERPEFCMDTVDGKYVTIWFVVAAAEVYQKALFSHGKLEDIKLAYGGIYVQSHEPAKDQPFSYSMSASPDLKTKSFIGFASPAVITTCVNGSSNDNNKSCSPSSKEYYTLTYKVQD